MPLHAPLMLRDVFKARSAPAPAIFDPLRSVFHSAHMLWLDIRGALKFFGRAWSCFRSDRNDGGMVD